MARWASFIVLLGILLAVAILFLQVMAAFLLPMFLAVLLVVMFRPVHRWILAEMPRYPRLAAGLTTAAILLIVLAPFAWILTQAALEGASLAARFKPEEVAAKLGQIRHDLHLHMPYRDQLQAIERELGRLESLEAQAGAGADASAKARHRAKETLKSVVQTLDAIARSLAAGAAGQGDAALGKALAELSATEEKLGVGGPAADAVPEVGVDTLPLASKDPPRLSPQVGESLVELAEQVGVLVESAAKLEQRFGAAADDDDAALENALFDARVSYQQFKSSLLGGPLAAWLKRWANPTEEQLVRLRTDVLAQVENWWAPLALGTTQFLGSLILGLVVMIVSLFFFLADGPGIIQALMRLSPLDERYEQQLVSEFDRVSRAVVVATLLSAFVQGLLAGAGFYLAGLEAVFLLTVLTMFLALIPFVGATAVWLPCSLYVFFYQGRPLAGVLLALYGACVVSVADNVIKPIILHGQSNLHPLLALLSVLGGVRALGPIGIFVGPMAVAFLQALLNIVNMELKNLEERREAGEPPLIPRTSAPPAKTPSAVRAP